MWFLLKITESVLVMHPDEGMPGNTQREIPIK
jgi:hypothetical protein